MFNQIQLNAFNELNDTGDKIISYSNLIIICSTDLFWLLVAESLKVKSKHGISMFGFKSGRTGYFLTEQLCRIEFDHKLSTALKVNRNISKSIQG